MKEFIAEKKAVKKRYRRVRRKFKRYKVGVVVCLIALIAAAVALYWIWAMSGEKTISCLGLSIAVLFFAAIVFCIANALAASGERDSIAFRRDERITVDDEGVLTLSYKPMGSTNIQERAFDRIETVLPLSGISQERHNETMERMELVADYTINKYKADGTCKKVERRENPLNICDYFSDMEQLHALLTEAAEKNADGKSRGA